MDTKQNLLPEREYTPWTEEMIEARKIASQNTIKFNTTGDMDILREMFDQPLDDVIITPPLHCNYGGHFLTFGHKVFVNANCAFQPAGGIEIGDGTFIGSNAQFYTTIHPTNPEERATGAATVRSIKIGKNVWIGGGVIVLPGVEIGDGTTIGAGSVVTRSIPARCVAVGNPCRVIKNV